MEINRRQALQILGALEVQARQYADLLKRANESNQVENAYYWATALAESRDARETIFHARWTN